MEYQYADFQPSHFRAAPRSTAVGDWTINHVSFATPETAARPPLVFLGGAFQNAWSFSREVKHFLPQRPVIIVDLPGQGQNNQLSGNLRFADLAALLNRFLEAQRVERVVAVGLSYGAGIAYAFAQQFPQRVDRVILGVSTARVRDRVERALRAGFWFLDRGDHPMFADGVVHHLLNLPLREQTGANARLIEALRTGMLQLTDVERVRYRHNTERLFHDFLEGTVSCPSLVFTARHDSFIAPFEVLSLFERFASGTFAMLDHGDHLAPIEDPRTTIALYDAFVNDTPLASVPGVIAGAPAVEACRERRMLDRRAGRRRDVELRRPDGRQWRAALLDYNALGCLVEVDDNAVLDADGVPIHVSIPAIGANGHAVLLPDARGARAVFLHDAFGTLGTMPVATVEMPAPAAGVGGRRVSIAERLLAVTDEPV